MNTIPTWLNNLIGGNTILIEAALLLFSCISVVLFYLDLTSSAISLIISINLTAIFFMFLSSLERKRGQLLATAHKLINMACSLAILGTIFYLMDYPGERFMLKLAVIFMCIAGVTYLFNYRSSWASNLAGLMVRILLIASTAYGLWLL